jgi:hypothetical protein
VAGGEHGWTAEGARDANARGGSPEVDGTTAYGRRRRFELIRVRREGQPPTVMIDGTHNSK